MKRRVISLSLAAALITPSAHATPLPAVPLADAAFTSPADPTPAPTSAPAEPTPTPEPTGVQAGTLLTKTPEKSVSRIRYTTTLENGSIAEVTGAVLNPTGPWEGEGPAPVIVMAPGTRGMADHCAASRGPGLWGQNAPLMSSVGLNYERPFYSKFTNLGATLVVTDYVGLGTPGVHSYANRVEQGRAVLDAARAIVPATERTTTPVGFFGYSQGGGAVAAAAELAAEYAPDVNLVATFAGAPPADLRAILSEGELGPVTAYAVLSFSARDADFKDAADNYFNSMGRFWLWENSHSCIIDSTILWQGFPFKKLTDTGLSMDEFIDADPRVSKVLDAQKLGRVAPSGAVLVGSAPDDTMLGHRQAMQLAADYEALGADVETLPIHGPWLSSVAAGGHVAGLIGQIDPGIDWMYSKLKAAPAL